MSYEFLPQAVADAGAHLGHVLTVMTEGVAFRDEVLGGYNVFSHEGDELGHISTADVSYAICFMKKRGRAVGKLSHPTPKPIPSEPAFTFAWEGWFLYNGRRM